MFAPRNQIIRRRAQTGAGFAIAALLIGPGCSGGQFDEGKSSGCGSSGGSADSTPEPVPLSRYVGSWKGTWVSLNSHLPEEADLKGEMTLTIEEDGDFSGQVTSTKTGQAGTVSGRLTTDRERAFAYVRTTFAGQSQEEPAQIVIFQTNDHLRGAMRVPNGMVPPGEPLPGTPQGYWPLVSFDLARD